MREEERREGEKERGWKEGGRKGERVAGRKGVVVKLSRSHSYVLPIPSIHPPSLPPSLPPSFHPSLFRYHQVMKAIWSALDQPGRNWRSVFKALTLLDHLVKNGAERVVEDVSETVFT